MDNVLKYFEKKPTFPKCKIEEYIYLKKLRGPYKDMKSNQQINTIIKFSKTKRGMRTYHRSLNVLAKHVRVKHYAKFLNQYLYKNVNDDIIYKKLRQYIRYFKIDTKIPHLENYNFHKCDRNGSHSQQYIYKITKYIINKEKYTINNYLDIGCGDCIKTKMIGNGLGLDDKNIYGADIPVWGGYNEKQRLKVPINITTLYNYKLSYNDNKFDLVTAFMVLHHVKNLHLFLTELNRVTKMGGYFIIKEHDAFTNLDYMLMDIQHAMYSIVIRNEKDYKERYYAKYYNRIEWDLIIQEYGFQYHHREYESNSIYFEIEPTRHYYTIYKKVRNLH